jgi:hypothetical protein
LERAARERAEGYSLALIDRLERVCCPSCGVCLSHPSFCSQTQIILSRGGKDFERQFVSRDKYKAMKKVLKEIVKEKQQLEQRLRAAGLTPAPAASSAPVVNPTRPGSALSLREEMKTLEPPGKLNFFQQMFSPRSSSAAVAAASEVRYGSWVSIRLRC